VMIFIKNLKHTGGSRRRAVIGGGSSYTPELIEIR
jgi:hypothetical protein